MTIGTKEAKKHIDELYKNKSEYQYESQLIDITNSLETISTDIYTEAIRFVYELIQNADDAAENDANEVVIEIENDYLIVSHNGKTFSHEDVEALTSVGLSTKSGEMDKTGYKGIGFKSVFSKSENVIIVSGEYAFRFDKQFHSRSMPWQIIPIWTETEDIPSDWLSHLELNQYKVNTLIRLEDVEDIFQKVKEIVADGRIMLFLRNMYSITVRENGSVVSKLEKSIDHGLVNSVNVRINSVALDQWIIFSQDIDIPTNLIEKNQLNEKLPEKIKKARKSSYTLAARIKDGKITPFDRGKTVLFAYLPTKVTNLDLPFLVNSDFITNASREALHEDLEWNQWLLGECASGLIKWLAQLAVTDMKKSMLCLIPENIGSASSGSKSRNEFYKRVIEESDRIPFCPTNSGELSTTSRVIIDSTGIVESGSIDFACLNKYIRAKLNSHQFDHKLLESELHHWQRLEQLGSVNLATSSILEFIASTEFQVAHRVEQNVALLDFLKNLSEKTTSQLVKSKIGEIAFIMDSSEKLRIPSSLAYSKNSNDFAFSEEFKLIHPKILYEIENQPDRFDWLRKIGLKEASDRTFFETILLPDIKSTVTKINALRITKYLFELYIKGDLSDADLLKLYKLPTLIKDKNYLIEAENCYLPDIYNPQLCLERSNLEVNFISEEYLNLTSNTDDLVRFFISIGVKENLWVDRVSKSIGELRRNYNPNWFEFTREEAAKNPNGYYGFPDTNIIEFDDVSYSFLMDKRVDVAKMIWNYLLERPDLSRLLSLSAVRYFGVGGYLNRIKYPVTNFFRWMLHHSNIAPTTNGQMCKIDAVYLNSPEVLEVAKNNLPIFFYEKEIPSVWRNHLPFRSSIDLSDYLIILSSISRSNEKGQKVASEVIKQIDKIYERLVPILQNLSTSQTETLHNWRENQSLVTQRYTYRSWDELVYIPKSFNPRGEVLDRVIYLPDIIAENPAAAMEFCNALGIKICEGSRPNYHNVEVDNTVKRELIMALNYLKLIVAVENHHDFNENYAEVISSIQFYTAQEISVELFEDSELIAEYKTNFFRDSDGIYYRGKWNKVINIEKIAGEICTLLGIPESSIELQKLLTMHPDERTEYLEDLGIQSELLTVIDNENNGEIDGVVEDTTDLRLDNLDLEPPIDRITELREKRLKYFQHGESLGFEDKLLELLNIADTRFEKGYVYHFTHVTNAAEILNSGRLLSRAKASETSFTNSASVHQLNISRNFVHDHVRFYFRPLTPTQYINEGLGRVYGSEKPSCPVPVFIKFPLRDLIQKYKGKVRVSNGNLSSSWAMVGNDVEFLKKFDFLNLYTEYGHADFMHASQQEMIIPDEVSLETGNYQIIVRTPEDKMTLINLLETDKIPDIQVNPTFYYCSNNFVEVKYHDSDLTVNLTGPTTENVDIKIALEGNYPRINRCNGLLLKLIKDTNKLEMTIKLSSEYKCFKGRFDVPEKVSIFVLVNDEERLIYLGN